MSTSLRSRTFRVAPAETTAWIAWALSGVAAGVVAWSFRTGVAIGEEPACLLRRVTHIACPTCGMTRALVLLAHGEWRAALVLHPWAPVLAAQTAVAWGLWATFLARGDTRRLDRWIPQVVAVNAAALVLIWLVRLVAGALPPT